MFKLGYFFFALSLLLTSSNSLFASTPQQGGGVLGLKVITEKPWLFEIRGVKAKSVEVFGHKDDLLKMLELQSPIKFTNCACVAAGGGGQCMFDGLPKVVAPPALQSIPNGRIVVVVDEVESLLPLLDQAMDVGSGSNKGRLPSRTPAKRSANNSRSNRFTRTYPLTSLGDSRDDSSCKKKICIDSKGNLSFGFGCEGGLEFEVTTSKGFKIEKQIGPASISIQF